MLARRVLTTLRRRIAHRLLHQIRRPFVLARIARPSEVRLFGYRLRTDPEVFHPVCFRSSRILAQQVLERPLRGARVLDMGTGAGPIAVAAAGAGAVVTACDINPRAVALARQNAKLNGLSTETIQSDLFAALADRLFDLICFNIPFYQRDPRSHFEAAYNAGRNLETVYRFARGSARHLGADGRVVIIFNEDSNRPRILDAFAEAGFSVESERVIQSLLENFHVAAFRRNSVEPE